MVVYTSAARDAAGGTTAMNALVDLGMVETNQGYANSGAAQRVRLVYRDEVSYAETGDIELDLQRLQEGSIPNVHAWRNAYGADIVSLWVENGGIYCGIGYQLTPISSQFHPYAVNVVVRICATGNYTFAHEMGHNMGACHDRIVNDCQPANGYGYGYIAPGGVFRTIMSYAASCGGCRRIQYFSSSTTTYQGQPVGVANLMDNRRMLDDTAATVANFRQCVVAPCGVPPTPPATATPIPTPTATATAAPTATPTPIPTATPTATPVAACSPRPPVAVATARYGDRLQVTLTPAGGARLQRLQLGALTNALVDLDALGQIGVGSGATISLPPETLSLTLYVRRVVPGQASHANLIVGDGCGDWPTFVGGGATAF